MVKVIFNQNNTPVAVVYLNKYNALRELGKVDKFGYTTNLWDGKLN